MSLQPHLHCAPQQHHAPAPRLCWPAGGRRLAGVPRCSGASSASSGANSSASSSSASSSASSSNLYAVLQAAGVEVCSLEQLPTAPGGDAHAPAGTAELLAVLTDELHLTPADVSAMLTNCPRLLSFSRNARGVLAFLRDELGFDTQQAAATVKRFPSLLGYGVKSHLVPHCHYLRSLGVSEQDLPRLILARPQVLGASIDGVITYLRKWLRIERTRIGALLWSYPIAYDLPRLVPSAGRDAAERGAASAATAADGSADAGDAPAGPAARPPLGSAERCTWLSAEQWRPRGGSSPGSDGGDGSPPPAPPSA